QRESELAAQIGLQIRHQESGGQSLSRYIRNDKAETIRAEAQKVVVIPAYGARGNASSCIFERFELGQGLWKEAVLHLRGDGELLGHAAFGFEFFRGGAALAFNGMGELIEADQGES